MMRAYNQTKTMTLRFIGDLGEATAAQVAEFLDITPAGSASYLLKLHRQGLINRKKLSIGRRLSRERVYWLSDNGFRKLAWLETREEVFYSEFADEAEAVEEDEAFVPTWSHEF